MEREAAPREILWAGGAALWSQTAPWPRDRCYFRETACWESCETLGRRRPADSAPGWNRFGPGSDQSHDRQKLW